MKTEILPPEKVHIDDAGQPYAKLVPKEGPEIRVPLRFAHVASPLGDHWVLFIVQGGEYDSYVGLWNEKKK